MPKPRKQTKQAQRSSTAWVLSGLVLAGAIGTTAWYGSRHKSRLTAPTAGETSVSHAAASAPATNQENPALFFAWLAQQTNASDLLNNGTALLERGRGGQAILCYRRALELKPDDEEAHFNLGVTHSRLAQWAEAEQSYREALKLFPEYVEAHNNLGNLLTRLKRFDEAVAEFSEALKLAPENASAHNNLGRALAEQGTPAEALKHFAEAARLDTKYVEARFNLGTAYLTLGRTNDAVAAFNETLRLRPDFTPARQALQRLARPPR